MKRLFPTLLLVIVVLSAHCQIKSGLDLCLRDEASGEWLIGLFDGFAVYDCEYWDYKDIKVNNGRYDITLVNGCELLRVVMDKEKNNCRNVTIGSGKKRKCSVITADYLPDYPTKDQTAYKDNNYRQGDTVTIKGWMKDFPKEVLDRLPNFDINTIGLFSKNDINAFGKVDSLGRFCVRIPVENTQQVYMDWRRSRVVTVLEPGETYFFFQDAKNHRRLMMGRNARVQNELLAHDIKQEYTQPDQHGGMTAEQVIDYKNLWVGMFERNLARLDSVMATTPNLSRKYEEYQRTWMMCSMGMELMQSSFYTKDRVLPKEVFYYVKANAWDKIKSPYTLIREYSMFLYYYLLQANESNPKYRQQVLSPEALRRLESEGLLSFSDNDHKLLDLWQQRNIDYQGADASNHAELDKKYEGLQENIMAFINRDEIMSVVSEYLNPQRVELQTIDSVCSDPVLRDICKARLFYGLIDITRMPLSDKQLEIVNGIDLAAAKNIVVEQNNKYVALQNRDFANAASLRPSTDVEGMSDGEKILRKITEPFKGRLVYVDFWGTWCSPCKDALREMHKLKEALKDLDVVYLYLCNNSSDESWKNVIKEYDLTGENCVHYNLPAPQQAAIEQYLNVYSFPTYKLIDKEGNIHDLDWRHVENMDALRDMMVSMGK